MSNDFPSSASGSSDVSSPQQFGRGNRNRPDRGKQKKKNPSEGDYESGGDDDEQGSYENRKQKSSVSLGIQNKVISKKQEIKPRKLPPTQTAPSVAIFLYKPGMELPSLRQYLNQIIEIRIASEYIHKSNPALMMRQIWGSNGVYASHSDAVCIGIHNGQLGLNDIKNTSLMYQGVALLCKVIKGKKTLNQALKPPLLSRPMKTPCAHCLKPEKAVWLQSSGSNPNHSFGTPEQLIQWASKMSLPPSRRMTKKNHLQVYCHEQQQLIQPENLLMKNMPPFNQGWIIWDMCNEPAQKYNLITFMDKQSVNAYENNTSYKLRTHVLYIENNKDKYEITMDPKLMDEDVFLNANAYIIYQVLNPSVVDLEFINNNGAPLPAVSKQLLYKSLPWSSFEWGNDNVIVNGYRIDIKCFRFVPIQVM